MGSTDEKSTLYSTANTLQKAAAVASIVAAFIGLILLIAWMSADKDDAGYGGYNWGELIFNYHPTFMYAALILGSFSAIVSYRILPIDKYVSKGFHGLIHTGAIICIIIGLTAVFLGNDNKSYNDADMYFSNFTSIHSFIGLGAVIIYFLNYCFGILHFLPSTELIPVELRKAYMPYHVFFGTFSTIAASMAVVTGVMELTAEAGCYYDIDSADLNPADHYHRLKYGCKLANGVGVLVYLSIFLLSFALYKFEVFGADAPGGAGGGETQKNPSWHNHSHSSSHNIHIIYHIHYILHTYRYTYLHDLSVSLSLSWLNAY